MVTTEESGGTSQGIRVENFGAWKKTHGDLIFHIPYLPTASRISTATPLNPFFKAAELVRPLVERQAADDVGPLASWEWFPKKTRLVVQSKRHGLIRNASKIFEGIMCSHNLFCTSQKKRSLGNSGSVA